MVDFKIGDRVYVSPGGSNIGDGIDNRFVGPATVISAAYSSTGTIRVEFDRLGENGRPYQIYCYTEKVSPLGEHKFKVGDVIEFTYPSGAREEIEYTVKALATGDERYTVEYKNRHGEVTEGTYTLYGDYNLVKPKPNVNFPFKPGTKIRFKDGKKKFFGTKSDVYTVAEPDLTRVSHLKNGENVVFADFYRSSSWHWADEFEIVPSYDFKPGDVLYSKAFGGQNGTVEAYYENGKDAGSPYPAKPVVLYRGGGWDRAEDVVRATVPVDITLVSTSALLAEIQRRIND